MNGPNYTPHCDNCRKRVEETFYVKFPAVDENQEQEFCQPCADKFVAWKKREITIGNLFDKEFNLESIRRVREAAPELLEALEVAAEIISKTLPYIVDICGPLDKPKRADVELITAVLIKARGKDRL